MADQLLDDEKIKKFNFSGGMGLRNANSNVKQYQAALDAAKSKYGQYPSIDGIKEQGVLQKQLEEALAEQAKYFKK